MSLVWVKCGSLPASTSTFYTLEHPQMRTSAVYPHPNYCGWHGSLVVGRRNCDRKVITWNPSSDAAAQQPWASCSHPIASARSLRHVEVEPVSHGDRGDCTGNMCSLRDAIANIGILSLTITLLIPTLSLTVKKTKIIAAEK